MVMWEDLNGGRCSMGDACSNPNEEDGVFKMLMKNFNRHYSTNRAPFGLFYHSAWFSNSHHRKGFLKFLDEINRLNDVFFVTNWQMIQWMRNPTPLDSIDSFEPWQCDNQRLDDISSLTCHHPSVCNVRHETGSRFMKTCQPCPSFYPWVGRTGFNNNKNNGRWQIYDNPKIASRTRRRWRQRSNQIKLTNDIMTTQCQSSSTLFSHNTRMIHDDTKENNNNIP